MKPFYQTAVIGLMLLAAAAPVYAASTLRFGLSVISVSEAAGHATVHVLRSGDLDTAVTVDYAMTAQSATAGLD